MSVLVFAILQVFLVQAILRDISVLKSKSPTPVPAVKVSPAVTPALSTSSSVVNSVPVEPASILSPAPNASEVALLSNNNNTQQAFMKPLIGFTKDDNEKKAGMTNGMDANNSMSLSYSILLTPLLIKLFFQMLY